MFRPNVRTKDLTQAELDTMSPENRRALGNLVKLYLHGVPDQACDLIHGGAAELTYATYATREDN
jgi:hypothetical protein